MQEAEEVQVGVLPYGRPIYMQRRRDVGQLMQELMDLCEVCRHLPCCNFERAPCAALSSQLCMQDAEFSPRPLYDEQGNRVCAGVSSGTFIEQQQARDMPPAQCMRTSPALCLPHSTAAQRTAPGGAACPCGERSRTPAL